MEDLASIVNRSIRHDNHLSDKQTVREILKKEIAEFLKQHHATAPEALANSLNAAELMRMIHERAKAVGIYISGPELVEMCVEEMAKYRIEGH